MRNTAHLAWALVLITASPSFAQELPAGIRSVTASGGLAAEGQGTRAGRSVAVVAPIHRHGCAAAGRWARQGHAT